VKEDKRATSQAELEKKMIEEIKRDRERKAK